MTKMPVCNLPPPNGPTDARLTIQPLEGLEAVKAKYAAEIEAGRALQKRLGEGDPSR